MTYCPIPAEVDYWNGYAQWYRRWRTHNDYHGSIIEELKRWVRPGWRVLDIGAADGVLALPLSQWGCRVTALEPAQRLREGLADEVHRLGIPGPVVSEKTWEKYNGRDSDPYDLVVACNSLHLMAGGFRKALAKIFYLKPRRVMVVAEEEASGLFNLKQPGYALELLRNYKTGSHFAYHDLSEVLAHWEARFGIRPGPEERRSLSRRLGFEAGHWWLKDRVAVRIFLWVQGLKGATGENAICRTVSQADCIVGPIAVTWANAMLGEVTPRIAEAVTSAPAFKILIPLSQEKVEIVGVVKEPLPHLVQMAVGKKIKEVLNGV